MFARLKNGLSMNKFRQLTEGRQCHLSQYRFLCVLTVSGRLKLSPQSFYRENNGTLFVEAWKSVPFIKLELKFLRKTTHCTLHLTVKRWSCLGLQPNRCRHSHFLDFTVSRLVEAHLPRPSGAYSEICQA